MTTSEQINEIATALAKAQAEMGGAMKDSANPFFKSKYADLASVWDACRVPLAKHGLSVVQFPTTEYSGTPEIFEWTSRSGETRTGIKVVCTVSVVTRLMHTSGQFVEDATSAMLASGDPQAVGSAITYLRRYSLQSVVGVAPEDDDGEAAHGRANGNRHDYIVEAPTVARSSDPVGSSDRAPLSGPSVPNGGDSGNSSSDAGPPGAVLILKVKPGMGKAVGFLFHSRQLGGSPEGIAIYQQPLKAIAEQCCQDRIPVFVQTVRSAAGKDYVKGITRATPDADLEAHREPVDVDQIPF